MAAAAMSSGMDGTVQASQDAARIAALEAEVAELTEEIAEWEATSLMSDPDEPDEATVLRDFIVDVRLGIRDLSEYEDVCG